MSNRATAAYVAPFAAFVALMAVEHSLALPAEWAYPLRIAIVVAVLEFVSWRVIPTRPSAPFLSAALGLGVFLVWIAPDVLFGSSYRQHWLFTNPLMGAAVSSAPEALKRNLWFIFFRVFGCVAVVPVVEELFWRGWLLPWLAGPSAFWIVAVLFASEHGPYWEVGLVAGIAYNWWFLRTKNLADCIVAHAVTNGLLSAYVLYTGHWQYWM
jgi:CAAX prenyl protease-like protein